MRFAPVLAALAVCCASFAAAASAPRSKLELFVHCGAGDDELARSWLLSGGGASSSSVAPPSFGSIGGAQSALRSLRASSSSSSASAATVTISGICRESLSFGPADSGPDALHPDVWRASAAGASVTGAVPLTAANLSPVTDPSILAQLQPSAAAHVLQIDLSAVAGAAGRAGTPQCRPYMGGEASILPGNLVSSTMELFWAGDPFAPPTAGGTSATPFSPLVLARWPNVFSPPKQWTPTSAVDNYTMTSDFEAAAARLPLWQQQLAEDPGSVYAHYINNLFWADHHNQVQSIAIPNASAATCGGLPDPGYDYNGNDLPNSPIPVASYADCCAACANASASGCAYFSYCVTAESCGSAPDYPNCYLKTSNAGRTPFPDRISGALNGTSSTAADITLAPCPSHYDEPGYDTLGTGGGFYSYNLLAELDMPGEYTLNFTSGMMYVWPPAPTDAFWTSSPWGAPVMAPESPAGTNGGWPSPMWPADVIAYLSVDDTLLTLAPGAYNMAFSGLVFEGAQGAGITAINATSISFDNCTLQNVGNMVLNVTGGADVTLSRSSVRHGGNGAVYFYAGDRQTLAPGNHVVSASSLSYSNRFMFCYVPMVALADVGNSVASSELFGGPHQGIFIQGNNHAVEHSLLHDLTQGASDSGAIYMGRDWTYQGNLINNNTFERIISSNGPDTSAVYLDDMISGFTISNNNFLNVSRPYLLGGGRSNLFLNNFIDGVVGNDAAVHIDNRGMNWDQAACSDPNGEMVGFLNRVPYNTSEIWIYSYPLLVNILQDEPCKPKYSVISGNTYCNLNGQPFADQSNSTLVSWGMSMFNNTPVAC